MAFAANGGLTLGLVDGVQSGLRDTTGVFATTLFVRCVLVSTAANGIVALARLEVAWGALVVARVWVHLHAVFDGRSFAVLGQARHA